MRFTLRGMTFSPSRPPASAHPLAPLRLSEAAQAYGAGRSERERALLAALDEYLGAGTPAPLLAYTKLTGEAWRRTLPASEQAEAGALLDGFRAFLRDEGWLDAARAVNLLD